MSDDSGRDAMAPRDSAMHEGGPGFSWRALAISVALAVVLSVAATLLFGGTFRPVAGWGGTAAPCGGGSGCCPPAGAGGASR